MIEQQWEEGYEEGDGEPEITTWDQFGTTFYHNFKAYTQEDYFLALKNMKQQGQLTYL